jgi:hypothetical protein
VDTINWLHLRGLALLALLGLFFIYALLVALCHDWRVKRRARRIAVQRKPPSAASAMTRGRAIRSAEPRALRGERSAADLTRRAA